MRDAVIGLGSRIQVAGRFELRAYGVAALGIFEAIWGGFRGWLLKSLSLRSHCVREEKDIRYGMQG